MSMLDLFRQEAESQVQMLTAGLLALERDGTAADQLESCMRAAHSLKGAARIVGLDAGAAIAHAMEDCFVAAQQGQIALRQRQIDLLLSGADLLIRIARMPEADVQAWGPAQQQDVDAYLALLATALQGGAEPEPAVAAAPQAAAEPAPTTAPAGEAPERVLRVTAENLNRLLSLTGESLVESRWLKPFSTALLRLKRQHDEAGKALDALQQALAATVPDEATQTLLADARHRMSDCQQALSQRLVELELFDSRSTSLAHRLYDEALACRMRPFADGTQGFPRLLRDLGRSLGKQVRLEVVGEATQVDRDILEKLDAPLGHLLRNALDHGIEAPEERLAAGKPAEGTIRLEARHISGTLQVIVSDDGRGIDLNKLRDAIVERGLTDVPTAAQLSEAELLEFLFLPGFTMKGTVTEISGRGVGLDVVQTTIKQVRGAIRVTSKAGQGSRFQLQLPLTLSVVRALLTEIGGHPYAFPLAHIGRTIKLPRDRIELIEGRQHFDLGGRRVGLVSAHQVLGGSEPQFANDEVPVIVIGDGVSVYGLVVDRFLGERELVVQPLDARLGKIQDIAAGALMADGSPVLIVDIEDLVHSVDKLGQAGGLGKLRASASVGTGQRRKRVLVVDDSLTVRELERKLLDARGYEVEIAVDGMDGWNAVRTGHFNLMVTDIDMPRMDGIELVGLVKKDPNLKSLPVMIVSYKDREEDRWRGLEAGADYYLSKGSFQDETLLQAVVDLIGEAET